jgi:hypothetical protein
LNLNSKHLETKSTIPGVGKRYAWRICLRRIKVHRW